MTVLFQERQRPSAGVVLFIAIVFGAITVGAWVADGERGWTLPASGVVAALLVMTCMRTFVTPAELEVKMFMVLPHRCPVAEIDTCEVVRYRPLRDYGGWGWRWNPKRGWCYTMRGDRGVAVRLRNGKRFLVGSQRPEELAAAIEKARRDLRPEA